MGTVLVTEATTADSASTLRALVAAGHNFVRCFPLADGGQRCSYVATGHCPVDDDQVDVALDVRGAVPGELAPREQGAVCALRAGIPVVVATDTGWDNPIAESTTTVPVADAVIAVTHALTTAPTNRVARLTADEVGRVLTATELYGVVVQVEVVVRDRILDLTIELPVRPPVAVRRMVRSAADRIAGAQWPPLHVGSVVYAIPSGR
ncbi:MAG: hypothetical protein ABIM89_02975 [Mycobacteriales bacterium]